VDAGGEPFAVTSEIIEENLRWKEKPLRIAVTLKNPVKTATIHYRIEPVAP